MKAVVDFFSDPVVRHMLTDKQFGYLKRLIQRRGFTITKKVEGEKEGITDIHAKGTDKKKKEIERELGIEFVD